MSQLFLFEQPIMIKYISIIFVVIGLSFDLLEFFKRAVQYIKKRKAASATPFLGLLIGLLGCIGLIYSGYSWFFSILIFSVILIIHISCQFILPLKVTRFIDKKLEKNLRNE